MIVLDAIGFSLEILMFRSIFRFFRHFFCHKCAQPLTYTEVAFHYNEGGERFPIACPVCDSDAFTLSVSRGPDDSPQVECDNDCPPAAIVGALTALVRGGSAPPPQSQAAKPEPRDQSARTEATASTEGGCARKKQAAR